jgi:DNA-binding NarL/FixJ family response regulator
VRELLESEGDIEVVGEAGSAAEAMVRVPAVRPQVAVLDVRLPDGDGVTVCRDLRSQLPELACLMLTSFSDDDALLGAVMAGAAGYVLKDIRGGDLVGAVRTVAAAARCSTPGRPPTSWLAFGTSRPRPARRPHRPGASDPRAHRRGADQPADRRAAVPGREDREEPRQLRC